MAKVAKLVYVSLMTRVVVDENASDDEIVNTAKQQLKDQIDTDLGDNIESIEDDEQHPHVEKTEDYYQEYLDDHYADNYSHEQLLEKFEYLTSTARETPIEEGTLQFMITNSLMGTALRKYAPIEFITGFNDWNP